MRYLTFSAEKASYKIAILVNEIRGPDIRKAYIAPYGLNDDDVIVITLHQSPDKKKKTPAAEIKQYIIEELTPTLNDLGVQNLIIGDGEYFKAFTKASKVDKFIGYVLPTEYGPWMCSYVPNYRTLFYDPVKVEQKIGAGIRAVQGWMRGTYRDPGCDIIDFAAYPETYAEIRDWLDKLLEMDRPLSIDIEAFGLKHYNAGIGTISFAWSKSEGIAFKVDYEVIPDATEAPFGRQVRNDPVRALLRAFFIKLKQRRMYHSISYDVSVLIYQLFMADLRDNEGLLNGLEIMMRDWDCTKLITYLATNSCAGNKLSLKEQAQEFAGNYAQEEITDICRIPPAQLLQYNLVDCLATWFVYDKHWNTVIKDKQLEVYETIFKPATVDIIQMQLTGMPVNMRKIKHVKAILEDLQQDAYGRLMASPEVQKFEYYLLEAYTEKKNAEWKKKTATAAEMLEAAKTSDTVKTAITFNPGSGPQLQTLLYEQMALPIIDRTKTKAPATGGKTLAKFLENTSLSSQVRDFLGALMEYKSVAKLLEAFIPALEGAQLGKDGWHWLFGNFNLGGTVSGRLSSSGPNLQNLPANVVMAISQAMLDKYPLLQKFTKKGKLSLGKLIKYCFEAPPGWFFMGIDFASLEDRISALTTKDPNKLKVYTDGYDGHSLRAHAYFGDQMTGIIEGNVESINSIQEKFPDYRQQSKTPTFLLTYGGTYIGIVQQLGWSEDKAKMVETRYHTLYKVSDDWIADKLKQATKDGYVTVAFGLRLRTPLLHQVILGTSKTPFQAEAEGRTAGNAMGQSWCLLNSRAMSEFMGDVRIGALRNDILPCAQIHDANYVLCRDDVSVIHYANTYLVKACEWQDHPDIWHDEVKLGGELSIFYPDWSQEISLPNGATEEEIRAAFQGHVMKMAA